METARRLRERSYQAFLVGGAVRDLSLGRKPEDWDIATSAQPKNVLALFPKSIPTGIDFGTVTVRVRGFPIQVTTFRKEGRYRDRRRPSTVEFVGDLASDLARRDFTVNAMAIDPITKEWFDPFGGIADLKKKKLRAVGQAGKRMKEDPLRLIRAGRFISQLSLRPDTALTKAARVCHRDLRFVSAERIRDELCKLLLAPQPSRGLLWMKDTGVLKMFLPELSGCVGVEQGGWHQFDVFHHTLKAIDFAVCQLTVRLALLLHDIAKPLTRTRDRLGYHFYKHERIGAEMSRKILRRLRFSKEISRDVETLIEHHLFEDVPISRSPAAVRRLMQRVGEQRLELLLAVRRGDTLGCGRGHRISPVLNRISNEAAKIRRAKEALSLRDLRVSGRDVMHWKKIPPGPEVGEILRKVLEEVVKSPNINKKKWLKPMILGM